MLTQIVKHYQKGQILIFKILLYLLIILTLGHAEQVNDAQFEEDMPAPKVIEKEKNNLFFNGHYRGRFDIYDGINKLAYGEEAVDSKANIRGSSTDTIYMQQIIAGFTYLPNENWEFKAYMYDARSWGSSLDQVDFTKNQGTADEYIMSFYDDHFELFETYVKLKNIFSQNLSFTLGRIKIGYGDSRVFGPGAWGNTMGWLWDAAHLSYKHNKDFFDIWYGQTRIKEENDFSIIEKHRYQGVGLYSHYEMSALKIEPFAAWRNTLYHDEVSNENIYYYGMRVFDYTPGIIYDATAIKAFGSYANYDIDAYAYAAKAGYQFDDKYQTRVLIGSVYASGDKSSSDLKKQTFSTPFGANDGLHYGRLDAMIWSNMQDYQASLLFKPLNDFSVELAYHHFRLAEATDKWYTFGYGNKPGNSYKDIGNEYDIILKYKATKDIDLMAIVAYLDAGEFITKNDIAQNDSSKLFLQFLYRFSTKE